MNLILATCAIALMAVIVVLYFRPYHYGSGKEYNELPVSLDTEQDDDDTCWRSVSIRPGLAACARAVELQNQVYASREAPPLPLGGCDEQNCRCHYLFADDRRSGLDRRAELDRLYGKLDDRRRSPGRRASDLLPA